MGAGFVGEKPERCWIDGGVSKHAVYVCDDVPSQKAEEPAPECDAECREKLVELGKAFVKLIMGETEIEAGTTETEKAEYTPPPVESETPVKKPHETISCDPTGSGGIRCSKY
jgi:hypothetical protein